MKLSYLQDTLEVHTVDEGGAAPLSFVADGTIGKQRPSLVNDRFAVVILQGWGTNAEVYRLFVNALSPYMRIIVPDFPGFGGSEEPSEPYGVEEYAGFVVQLLGQLHVERAILIGHSHGGRVAIALAARKNLPFAVEKLVLMDSAGIVPQKTLGQRCRIRTYHAAKQLLMTKPMQALFPGALDRLQKKLGSADYAAASPVMRKSLVKSVNTDLSDKMPHIRIPVLLIWGEKDTATPLSMGKQMEQLFPDAGLVVVPGGGHYSFLDNPNLVLRVLYSFFQIEANGSSSS